MKLIRYWTTWNMTWYLLSEFNQVSVSPSLKISVINTSILGFILTYIYPRKMIIAYRDKDKIVKKRIPYKMLIIFDFICHHLPMLRTLSKKTKKKSSLYIGFVVLFAWYARNKFYKVNLDRLYGVEFKKLMTISFIMITLLLRHYNLQQKKENLIRFKII